jgi:hypothetical protein
MLILYIYITIKATIPKNIKEEFDKAQKSNRRKKCKVKEKMPMFSLE